jgi:predicted ATPase
LVAHYDRDRDRNLGHRLSQDPAVGAQAFRGWVLWLQGYPEQAIAAKDTALELAEELEQPYTLGYAVSFAAVLHKMLRQWSECKREAERAIEIGQGGPFPSWQAIGMLCRGWVIAHQAGGKKGIAEAQAGIDLWTSIGARLLLPFQHTLLAETYLVVGMREEGLEEIEASFEYPQEKWWLPEQHRIRAELLLLAPGTEQQAEASLRQALDLARSSTDPGRASKALELRAATSLARLLKRQGRVAEGRELLADTYGWFTEGLHAPDLRETRDLLAELARGE